MRLQTVLQKLTLGLIACLSISPAYGLGVLNNSQILQFNVRKGDTTTFHCTINSDKVTVVSMQNHNCLISGFDANGKLEISSSISLVKLNHSYFNVIKDPRVDFSLTQNVEIHFDGDDSNGVVCEHGTGGRHLLIGLLSGSG